MARNINNRRENEIRRLYKLFIWTHCKSKSEEVDDFNPVDETQKL